MGRSCARDPSSGPGPNGEQGLVCRNAPGDLGNHPAGSGRVASPQHPVCEARGWPTPCTSLCPPRVSFGICSVGRPAPRPFAPSRMGASWVLVFLVPLQVLHGASHRDGTPVSPPPSPACPVTSVQGATQRLFPSAWHLSPLLPHVSRRAWAYVVLVEAQGLLVSLARLGGCLLAGPTRHGLRGESQDSLLLEGQPMVGAGGPG